MLEIINNMNLVFKNARTKKGNILVFEQPIPFNGSTKLPNIVLQGTIFDVQEDTKPLISIYRGNICTIEEICNSDDNWLLLAKMTSFNPKDKLCYYEAEGKKVVYAEVGPNDIVVPNIKEFKRELERISSEYFQIQELFQVEKIEEKNDSPKRYIKRKNN